MGQRTLKVDKIIPEGGILHIDGQVTATSLQETSNPWEPVNDVDIKFISGNVGVGTDTPTYKLDVHGTANVGVLTTTSISGDGSGLTNIQKANIPDLIQEQWTTLNDNILYFQNSNVGIATSTPAYKLDVHGTANVGALNVTSITGDGSGLTNIDGSAINNLVNQWTSDENDLRYEDGKVGVGKGTPNHTFDVNGNVNATSLSLSDSDVPVYLTSNANAASIAQWSKEIGGDTNIVRDVAIDSNGNTFVTGEYTSSSSVTIGTGVSLSSTTETNVYLIKYNSSGVAEWALNMIGQGNTVTIDSDGNVYISGRYDSGLNINVPSTDETPLIGKLVPTTRGAAFLVKYNNDGVAQWATRVDGTDVYNGDDIGRNLAIDSSGSLYLTGSYSGHNDLTSIGSRAYSADGISPSIQLPDVDNHSAFLIKYNSDGTPQWVKGIDASGDVIGYGVAVDSGSNVFMTGEYTAASEVDVGNSKNLPITTDVASFLIKYDTMGTTQWTRKIDGSSTDKGVSIVTGKDGNVHILGNYTSGAVVVSPFITLPDTSGDDTTFLLTYDTQGVAQWATTIDGVGADVVTDSTGAIFVTGSYSSSNSNVSSTDGKDITLVTPSGSATFLVEYSPNGILRSSTHIDGTSNESGNALAVDSLGQNVHVSGTTGSNSVIYNSDGTQSGLTLTNGPGFVVKYETSKPLKLNVSSNLEVGTANLFVDTATGRVGANTTTPQATLHVEGNVYASSNLEVGTANLFVDTATGRVGANTTTPQATLHVEGNVYASSNLEVGGANLFVDTQTSRVGVGTRAPDATLHVEGNVYASSNLEVGGANLFVDTQTSRVGVGTRAPDATLHVEGNVYASSNLEVGGANLFVDTQTSRVGVGTRAPDATLHVEGNVYASSNLEVGGANLFVDTQTSRVGVGTRAPDATLHVEGNVYASSNLEVGGANLFVDTQTSRVGVGTRAPDATLHVEGNVYASSNLEVGGANLFVDTQTSRVGVGTRAPDATLHVEGNVYASSNLEVGGANLFVDTQTSRVGVGTRAPDATLHVEGNVYASSNLEVGGANLFVDTQTSRVGVGTRAPDATLHVEGNVYASSNLEVGGANLFVDTQTSRVGVGTRAPDATLHVEGNVYASSNLEVGGANLFVDTQTSRVGVGTRAPDATLHVEGNVYASSNLEVGGANLFVDTEVSRVGVRTRVPGFDLDVNGDINFTGDFYKNGVLFTAIVGSTPWSTLNSNISYTAGNVSIGVIEPSATLHVEGNVYASSNLEVGGANLFVDTQTSRVGVGTRAPEANLHVEGNAYVSSNLEVGGANLFVDTQTSRVGVGTRAPEANLHVEGNAYVSSNLEVSNINFTGSFNQNGAPFVSSPWTITGDDLSYTTGRVGVGTSSPNANLHVEGDAYVSSNLEVGKTTISTPDQTPNVLWATSIGGTSFDDGRGIATDSNGNVYVIGYSRSSSITIGSTTLTNSGSYDVFVAKYDASGTVQWATSIGGTSADLGIDIATDSLGNVYLVGYYSGTATFGSTTLTGAGSYDVFVAKYDTSGTVQWATSIGGTDSEIGNGIATDSNGNVYVTGNYRSSITIGSTTLTNSGFDDVFVAKYDTSGTVQWATSIGGTSTDNGYGIATDSNGNVYVIGEYNSGSITIGSTTLTGAGSYDVFVAKYDTSGTVQWATSIGGTNSEYGRGIATDSNGNVYVIGGYSGTLTIGSTTLTGAGSNDAFVAKYDTSGTVQWATSIGGTSYDNGYGIATDSGGNVYVTGNYSSGSITIGSTTLTSAGSDDAFVAKYDTSGTVQWATSIGGTSTDLGIDIATDSNGNVYVIGNYYGSITIGSTTLTNSGSRDAFVVKYSSPPIYLRINAGLEVGSSNLFVDTRTSRVGIGTTTPGYTLDVQGDLNVSGTTTNVSDKRLKSNVHVIENALEKVGKLSGYTFTMNNKQNAGVIAQEVLEVLPEVVGGSEETTYSVAYGNMASLFIEAIKELKREIEVLKTKD
jgi:hypothetical protein